MTSRSGFDELRFPDDSAHTITKGEWERAQQELEERGDEVRGRVEVVGYSGSRLA